MLFIRTLLGALLALAFVALTIPATAEDRLWLPPGFGDQIQVGPNVDLRLEHRVMNLGCFDPKQRVYIQYLHLGRHTSIMCAEFKG